MTHVRFAPHGQELRGVHAALAAAKIEIALPQQDIHIRRG